MVMTARPVNSRNAAPRQVRGGARVAVFLASPLAGWVTGQIIAVAGGQLL
jgi:NAD(P)-dependent dehydrogenase (short-subunit alcohol dehydrogenase family)